jgi:hypothetical protein
MHQEKHTQQKKEPSFTDYLEDLFDVAHADALTLITIAEDSEFLLAQTRKMETRKYGVC